MPSGLSKSFHPCSSLLLLSSVFSSPIVEISENHGFLYAPVVNVEVTKGKAHVFNYLGTSLVNVTFKNHLLEAPKTTRIVPYLFGPEDINFGSLGSGYWGGNWVYVFGTTKAANSESGGIVVARVARYSEEYKDRVSLSLC